MKNIETKKSISNSSSKIQASLTNVNLIAKNSKEKEKKFGKTKWKTRKPEAIKMLKELIKDTSKEEDEISTNNSMNPDIEVSVHYLNSNKIDSSRSSFTSTMIQSESVNSKFEINQQKSKRLEKSLSNFQENLSKSSFKFKKANSGKIQLDNENSMSVKNLTLNSKSSISNKIGDRTTEDESSNSLRSRELKTKSEFQKPYLRKNSSYLETYIKLNSRQNVSNSSKLDENYKMNGKKSKMHFSKMKIEKEQNVNKRNEISNISKIIYPENNISQSSELRVEISSKSYQVSLETSSGNSDVLKMEINSDSDETSEKREQIVNKTEKSFLALKKILEKYGLHGDLVEEAERYYKGVQ